MSRWRVPVAGVLAWLAVVAVGSTAVWWVIASVGEDLGPEPSAGQAVPGLAAGPGVGPGAGGSAHGKAGGRSEPGGSAESSGPSTPAAPSASPRAGSSGEGGGPGASASQRPQAAPEASPGSTASGSARGSEAPSAAATGSSGGTAPAAEHQRTWAGRGGYVTVRCRGAQVGLVAAQPDSGYAVDVSDRGPERVEVSFEGRTEDDGRHVEVRAGCVDGRPSYQVSTGDGGHDE